MEDLYEVISRKMRETRKANQQLCTGTYQPSDSAQQLLASSLSFYLRTYICTLSNSKACETS